MIVEDETERQRVIKARWRQRHKDKAQAQNKISSLIEQGKITPPNVCSNDECNEANGIEAHHPDYSKPLIIKWLCRKCHLRQHKKVTEHQQSSEMVIKGSRMAHLDPKRIQRVYNFLRLELSARERWKFAAMADITYASIANLIKYVEKRYNGNIKTSTFEKIEKTFLSIIEKQSADDYIDAVTKVRG